MKKKCHIILIVFITLNFQISLLKTQVQVCFTAANDFMVGASQSIINADFNGDGKFDLAVTNSNSLTLLLGNGLGSFGSVANFGVGSNPISVISLDFNGDYKADLVTANKNSNNVSVLLGDGVGGFGSASDFAVGTLPSSVIGGDFNGDGKVDLATANSSGNNVSVLLGNGAGGFGPSSNFTVGTLPSSVISADFNGDGKADLAVANANSDNISVLLGDGLGNFGSATNFAVGALPLSVISSDFNGDGKADLASANANPSNVSILLGDGAGGFGTVANYTVGINPYSIITADFNGDGKSDLATANYLSNNVSVLLGDGIGSFAIASSFTVGYGPCSVNSADFDGDGKTDLAFGSCGSANLSILLNHPFQVTAQISDTVICAGAPVILTGGGAASYTWTGGVNDGVTFAAPLTTTTYSVTGTIGGCSNTVQVTLTVNPQPTATFTTQNENSSLYCDGSVKANLTGGTGFIQSQWLDSSQTVLASIDSIGALCHGVYTLFLIDSNNCTNIYTQVIQAGPIPPTPPVCWITVDSTNTHNVVVWEKTNLNMIVIDSFVVYREIGTNTYQRIGAVLKDSLSIFDDWTANPATTGYRYKLKSKNAQGVPSLFSDYHNTIYLNNTGGNLNWTPYQIENTTTPVFTYNVYRDDISNGNFQLIGNTTGNQFGYTDVNFSSFPNASYCVEADLTSGTCHPTRSGYSAPRSNVKHIGNVGIQHFNSNSAINIYPNPASNTLTITGITNKTTIRIYDTVGKLVMEKRVESDTTINTGQFAEGIYALVTTCNSGETINKVVISR